MTNNLVAYSKAGDVFHYRWAARRCLRLIYPNSSVWKICIEGSNENEKAGEYVIDVSEYSTIHGETKKIDYYQLKHTTVQEEEPFTLSGLEDTFAGFAKRYLQHKEENASDISNISFAIITNRKIADSFKENLSAIVKGEKADKVFQTTIEKYTGLTSDDLVSFCSIVHLEDGEGNYNVQKEELRIELSQLVAGSIDNAQIENLVALIQEKVLPDSDNSINREEVLKRFGISSEKELYPAPAVWENLENIIERKQHILLKEGISNSLYPVIVHAAGGVGKSVFCLQLTRSLPEGSLGIVYDCFGAGSYRNRSETRHTHKDALVQIINELASKGLCDPLLPTGFPSEKDLMRKFLIQVESSVKSLREATNSAQLFILIDAADNAEMAAAEYSQSCFAHELVREKVPDGCKLVLLCRTERIDLLNPQSFVTKLELEPFSKEKTLENLKKWFPTANENDGAEFHRLTSGNPRVQANALDVEYRSINELLASLGPSGTSVEEQIKLQLNSAISKIRDQIPDNHYSQIDSICRGLASLPPHIPIEVLSKVANVSTDHVKSFVSDIGRSLWLSDTSIQFRDEPTETWFRNTFLAKKENHEEYIAILEPLAHQLSYVAEVLPQLYLQAEQYDKLINIALSDDYLPENNPIDARNIRVYRLQFAFKAALKLKNYKDAVKLAMRAGEEVAGTQRQTALFQYNIDLLTTLQSKEKIQEIAFRRLVGSGWTGSENVYSASLLSGIKDYHGEARGYLRAATNWLHIYFEEQKKTEERYHNNALQDNDVLELAYANLNIHGVKGCADFLFYLKPKEAIFRVIQCLIRRLIDVGRLAEIKDFLDIFIREPYYLVATVSEVIQIGWFPEKSILEPCLDLLCSKRLRIPKQNNSFNDQITPSIIFFAEACLYRNLSPRKITRVVNYYIPIKASRLVYDSHFSNERDIFIRALAIRKLLSEKNEVDIEEISPLEFVTDKNNYRPDNEIRKFEEVINGLFPWYSLRVRVLHDKKINILYVANTANESSKKATASRYRSHDTLPSEIALVVASIMVLHCQATQEETADLYKEFLQNNDAFKIADRLNMLRAAYRSPHLAGISQQLELSTYELIKGYRDDGPEEIANRYIALARAVLINDANDASIYFNEAIDIASKFGDELVQRWEAIVSLAQKACEKETVSNELSYRFIRCAELVGETVSREKHWSRSEAMRVCTKMSPGIGISALSRWRDRDIGRFDYQLEAVLTELVSSKVISINVGWALARLFSHHHLNEFLSVCLENEPCVDIQRSIFEDAVHLLRVEGASPEYWVKLNEIAIQYNIDSEALNSIIAFYAKEKKSGIAQNSIVSSNISNDYISEPKWNNIFEDLNISTIDGFNALMKRLKSNEKKNHFRQDVRDVLKEAINRLDERSLLDFTDAAFISDDIGHYDIQHILASIPQAWKNKVSYREKFPSIVHRFGEKYAHELTNEYSFNSFVENLNLDKPLTERLIHGILSGLANGNDFADASIFFGFVKLVSPIIKSQDAVDLSDYALSRFELHIETEFGDGVWRKELDVSEDINENIAGFIWSALGSPRSKVRWNAAHCIKKLAEFDCTDLIDALVSWLEHDKVDAFGHHKFPFYNLHARQYLLIAFTRVSIEKPNLLRKYGNLFLNYSLSQPHVLIQKFAADIIINLEKAFSGIHEEDILASVKNIGKGNIPTNAERLQYSTDSHWHKEGIIETGIDFYFAWDFDRYWYKPLGDVFGVSSKQIQDLAANLIVKKWGLGDKNGYNNDPRVSLWNRSSQGRETWHDHGSYPQADNLDFYLSYHSMLVVAAMLIEKMPVVKKRDWFENEPWTDWLSRHLLTRQDGKWLADCRDALPLNRPLWISQERNASWQTSIVDEDFLSCLTTQENGELWINVNGGWHEKENERTETFSVSTALVSTKTSDALLRALTTCSDSQDYKLPDYGEDDMEINSGIFQLKGWIDEHHNSKGLDEHDPYAGEIYYPPYTVGIAIAEALGLNSDSDEKTWRLAHSSEKVLFCETWRSYEENRDKEPSQSGI